MIETYRCHDGREVVLTFNADSLLIEAGDGDGETIARFQFGLVAADGRLIELMGETGKRSEAVSLKLVRSEGRVSWSDQGIKERAIRMVADETKLDLAAKAPNG